MRHAAISEVRRRFGFYFDAVIAVGPIIITRYGKPVVLMISVRDHAVLNSSAGTEPYPDITIQWDGIGHPQVVIKDSDIRVEQVAIAVERWGWSPVEFANKYGVDPQQAEQAMAFYAEHQSMFNLDTYDGQDEGPLTSV